MHRAIDSNGPVDPRKRFEEQTAEVINRLFPIVCSWTHDVDIASDVIQEALTRFLTYMQKRDWSQIRDVDALLTEIAHNYWHDLGRMQRNKRLESLDHDPEGTLLKEVHRALMFNGIFTGIDPEQLEQLLMEVPLQMIFSGLSEEDVELFIRHEVDRVPLEEIAAEMGKDVGALKYRLIQIRAKIRYRARQYLKATGKKSLF